MSRKRLLLVIAVVSAVAAAGATLVVWRLLVPAAPDSLQEYLSKTDGFISRSYLAEAKASVERAYRAAAGPEEYMRVLKRAYALARLENKFEYLKARAVASFEKFPSRADLCRIALYACLRDGDIARALSLKNAFPSLPEVQALQAEVLLKNETPPTDPALAALPAFARYVALDAERNPERFLAAGRELGDDRFFLDAALLYMAEGKLEEADDTARKHLLATEFDEPAGLIAYEANAVAEAEKRLANAAGGAAPRPDLQIILGDWFLTASRPERAAGSYEQALRTDPSYSFVPYLNLAWVSRRQGFDERALALLREAARRFPENEKIVFELSKTHFYRNEKGEARLILDEFLKKSPDNFNARLLKLFFEQEDLSAERLLLRLKDLYFENPKAARAAETLTARLLQNQDLAGVRAILTHYAEVNGGGQEAWLANARGVLEAVTGDLSRAAARFGEAVALRDCWEYRYNRAAVSLETGKPGEARADLERARADLDARASEGASRGKALVHALLAAVYLKMEKTAEAEREVNAALSFDPKSPEAHRVRRGLEAAGRR